MGEIAERNGSILCMSKFSINTGMIILGIYFKTFCAIRTRHWQLDQGLAISHTANAGKAFFSTACRVGRTIAKDFIH